MGLSPSFLAGAPAMHINCVDSSFHPGFLSGLCEHMTVTVSVPSMVGEAMLKELLEVG